MSKNRRLIESIDKVIDALTEMRKILEEETGAENAEGTREELPLSASVPREDAAPEVRVNEVKAAVYRAARTMTAAARLASESCQEWKFQDDELSFTDFPSLIRAAGMQDTAHQFGPEDTGSFYIVSGEGAIGVTENEGKDIVWLYIPFSASVDSFPASLAPDEAPENPADRRAKADKAPAAPEKAEPAPVPEPQQTAAPEPQKAPAPEPQKAASSLCPVCGKTIKPGVKFCIYCGSPLAAAPAPAAPAAAAAPAQVCRTCGAKVKPGDKFCLKCGTRL